MDDHFCLLILLTNEPSFEQVSKDDGVIENEHPVMNLTEVTDLTYNLTNNAGEKTSSAVEGILLPDTLLNF